MKPQVAALLHELRLRGRAGLTPLEALDAIGTLRLGARVWDLKAEGFDVESELITTPSGKRVSRYWLAEPKAHRHVWVVERQRQWGTDRDGSPLMETQRWIDPTSPEATCFGCGAHAEQIALAL